MIDELTGSKRRPGGISFLCIVLVWLCLMGFGNALILATGRVDQLPPWLSFVAAIYGIAAGVASVGLWHMRYWGLQALTAWMAVCELLLVCFVAVTPSRLILGGHLGVLVFMVVVGFAFVLVYGYVRRAVTPSIRTSDR